jgi:flavorubredoxin
MAMRALVVYESMFGNTRSVAEAVAAGLGVHVHVDLLEVGQAPVALPPDVALLVVGGPTHVHGMTTPKSRADAANQAADGLVTRGIGIREWLDAVRPVAGRLPAAAFDTRIHGPELIWGSAAKATAKRLRELGFRVVREPHSFLVDGPTGPLVDRLREGELARAEAWGTELAGAIVTAAPAP